MRLAVWSKSRGRGPAVWSKSKGKGSAVVLREWNSISISASVSADSRPQWSSLVSATMELASLGHHLGIGLFTDQWVW